MSTLIIDGIQIGSGHITGKKKRAFQRFKKLENDRSSWRTHWMEITDYILPRRGRYLIESQSTKGRVRTNKIIDNTGGFALRTLKAGMMAGLTNPARPWFRFQTRDRDLMKRGAVKKWLTLVEQEVRGILHSSNFYFIAPELYGELGAFGTSVMLRRRHPEQIVHYRPFTAGEYVIAENEYGEVDTLGREFTMTVAQIVARFIWDEAAKKFHWDRASPTVKTQWDASNYDQPLTVYHMIQPRALAERDFSRLDGPNRAWADLYFEAAGDKEVFLQESGYDRKPFFAARWSSMGGDLYGYSPGMETLADVKQLQHQQRRKAQAIDKMSNPPMVASAALKGKPTTVLPGGTTYVNPVQGAAGFQPAYLVNPRIAELSEDIRETQGRIDHGFYADLFAAILNSSRRSSQPVTALEIAETQEEKLVLLTPVLQRLNVEKLDPMINDAFLVAFEMGRIPDAPSELQGPGGILDIKYVSLLAQAMEAVSAGSIERVAGFAGNLAAVKPEALDNINADEMVREYADVLGSPPSIITDRKKMDEVRAARAQEVQRQQQMEEATIAAQGAKVLSEADTQNPNALTRVLDAGGVGGG